MQAIIKTANQNHEADHKDKVETKNVGTQSIKSHLQPSSISAYGAAGCRFEPYKEKNTRNGKEFYYQHLCIRDDEKSSEELRFEDYYGIQ